MGFVLICGDLCEIVLDILYKGIYLCIRKAMNDTGHKRKEVKWDHEKETLVNHQHLYA